MNNIFAQIRPPDRYVSLHNHSTFSPFDGLGEPKEHIDFVLSNEMDSWALTDHGNGNGLAHAHAHAKRLKAKGQNFRQIYGVEFYFVPDLGDWQAQYDAYREEKKQLGTAVEKEDAGHVVEDDDETRT